MSQIKSLEMETRLNKFISDSGYCSRREADKFIERGRVTVNKRIALLGDKVNPNSVVKVNGNLIEQRDNYVYIALNKPAGITCTTDKSDSTNVVDFVRYPTRIFHIGRLDKDSEGLILLTDNGDIVNKILRSTNNHEKEYEVFVDKSITKEFLEKLRSGVDILGVTTKSCNVEKEGDKNFRITLTQGLNRQIRRMCEVLGYEVLRLKRERVMNITLDKIPLGHWRFLDKEELVDIFESIKDSSNEKRGSGASRTAKKSNTVRRERFKPKEESLMEIKPDKRPIGSRRTRNTIADAGVTKRTPATADAKKGAGGRGRAGVGAAKSSGRPPKSSPFAKGGKFNPKGKTSTKRSGPKSSFKKE